MSRTSSRLPVIIGHGGVNAAGRLSGHHAYKRMVIDALGEAEQATTYASLAALMNLDGDPADTNVRAHIKDHTLIRKIESFDSDAVYVQRAANLAPASDPITLILSKRSMPKHLPADWQVSDLDDKRVSVTISGGFDAMLPDHQPLGVGAAGQLPTGFEPGKLYQSRSHPRGLHITVYGASDALMSSGVSIQTLKDSVRPDEIAVYSGSAQGQLDDESMAGLCQFPLMGKRTTSKHISMSLAEMPGDFVNAYVLGSVGSTGAVIGACATYLYNLQAGINDITSGRRRVVLVGNSEAPVLPHVIEAYRVMGALTEDADLLNMDGGDIPNWRRACRPFSENAGFTVAEGSAYTLLVDDELALELGAHILGSAPGAFVNADGYKKSISGPGVGNYITVGKALSLARDIVGDEAVRTRSYMQAHGTGTPQNRVTESHILNELAKRFGIQSWPVGAIKSYIGHTMAPAGGDSLAAILGTWQHGWVPGIQTIDAIADDVHASNLDFPLKHLEAEPDRFDVAFVNSKGFGGNNATGVFLSPDKTLEMLRRRHGDAAITNFQHRQESVAASIAIYEADCLSGSARPIYQFGEGVVDGEALEFDDKSMTIPGFAQPVSLASENPFEDMK